MSDMNGTFLNRPTLCDLSMQRCFELSNVPRFCQLSKVCRSLRAFVILSKSIEFTYLMPQSRHWQAKITVVTSLNQ